MTVLPLIFVAAARESRRMDTFLNYLTVIVVFALIALPSLLGVARDRRIDRQIARAGAQRLSRSDGRYELSA
jgi:branched-subunit amino acid transport protein